MKKCAKCKEVLSYDMFHQKKNISTTDKTYYRSYCIECGRKLNKTPALLDACKRYRRTPNGRYKILYQCAKRINHDCNISFEEYMIVISKPCHYCNGYFEKTEVGTGLDRIDSNKGYIVGNIVSCCYTCNMVKGDRFTVEETKAAIQAVISIRLNQ